MADEKRDMQEALDEVLEPASYRNLLKKMDADQSAEFQRLRGLDGALREAKTETAPRDLAANILAKVRSKALPEEQPLKAALSLATGLLVVALLAIPILLGISLWLLAVLGSGTSLSGAALVLVGAASLLLNVLPGMTTAAQTLLVEFPFIPVLLILVPLSAVGLRYLRTTRLNTRA